MAEDEVKQTAELEGSTYEVIRKRLVDQGADLKRRVEQLNNRRMELFGGNETTMLATERVRTEHNCIPRDIVPMRGDKILLGYQVFMGLKTEMAVSDVFSKIGFDGENLHNADLELLTDPTFTKDFKELFQYYKDAKLLQLRRTETHLLMVFQTGERESDFKVLRWGISGDKIAYIDNRGERDHVFPPAHDFAWERTTREDHLHGQHPHVNVADTIFVECVGGDLTVKVEDNTDSGAGIFAEDVDDPNQGLDDAEILFADLESSILLKIRPYREDEYRYIVYNKQTREAARIDTIGFACQELPEGHGLIFPNGFYLSDGSYKVFPIEAENMEYIRQVRSPNGEDVAYIYHHRINGLYHILQYNLISREVANPLICNGYSLFPDGKLVLFRADTEPSRMHAMQIWQTPFCTEEHAAAESAGDGSHLATIGNRDLVRGISDVLQINRLIANQRPSAGVYEELIKIIGRAFDSYHWLGHAESFGLQDQLQEVQRTANQVIDEFEKVQQLTAQAAQKVGALDQSCKDLFRQIHLDGQHSIDDYVTALSDLRARRGQVDTTRDMRYVDAERLDALDEEIVKRVEELSNGAVQFLLQAEALAGYTKEIAELEEQAENLEKVSDAEPLTERVDALGKGLDLLMEIVNTLEIDDATQRTDILERISEVYGQLNRARAVLEGRRKELGTREGRAEFGAQFKLLAQAVSNSLGLCDTPEKTDEFLAKLMVQVEELEARFVEFDEFAEQLGEKREEIYETFQGRKQQLLDERNRHAAQLGRSADRILTSVRKRTFTFEDLDSLNAYLASDPMVMKLRGIIKELGELGDSVKADDYTSQLKASREDAVRNLRDKTELFDGDTIKLGRHKFSVNRQALELTLLPRDEGMAFHLTGTDYYEEVEREDFLATRRFWSQEIVSENDLVYRGEYLAYQILRAAQAGREGLSMNGLREAALEEASLLELIRRFASDRYEEGYERGLHDADTVKILTCLLHLVESVGLLRFPAPARAIAVQWFLALPEDQRTPLVRRCRSLIRLRDAYGPSDEFGALARDLGELVATFAERNAWPVDAVAIAGAGEYLIEQLGSSADPINFAVSGEADQLLTRFFEHLDLKQLRQAFVDDLVALASDLGAARRLAVAWLERYIATEAPDAAAVRDEVAGLLLAGDALGREVINSRTSITVEGLLGQHERIADKAMDLRIDEFLERLERFADETVPAYRAYQDLRRSIIDEERERLRLEEFKPRVLTSFVRNKLINEVYLKLIGDNLAKQMGAVGDSKRTDLMGLLLLISPPGYGKTTLMEYVASVLGLTFMKINGPAIGHEVTSLDPTEAPNATARQELQKLNLSLEMGNNVMIYLDDIQHCNPELLQKFISLCDGQRRIEGVWRGKTRTYDLRGKKVCVVMAGNPYTESGEKFQIPDMLANRADTYNLGDIIGGSSDAFELSYLENCLTVNPVLNPVASRSQQDFYTLLRIAEGDDEARSQLEHPYSAVELDEICTVLRKLRKVQSVLLQVNLTYIQSASMADEDRVEPPFKLQGSYRNMAKLAEKVVAVMNDEELDQLILDHYLSESQTLTSGAEANVLKFREMTGWINDEERARWQEICRGYSRRQELAGGEDDPMANALLQLIRLNEQIGDIGGAISGASQAADARALKEAELVQSQSEQQLQLETARAKQQQQLEQARAEREAAEAEQRGAVLARQIAPLLEQLADKLGEVAAKPVQVAAPAPPTAPAPTGEAKVEVINTLPKYYGKLYQHHIDVIEHSLAPTLSAIGKHLDNSAEVKTNLKDLVDHLRGLISEQASSDQISRKGTKGAVDQVTDVPDDDD